MIIYQEVAYLLGIFFVLALIVIIIILILWKLKIRKISKKIPENFEEIIKLEKIKQKEVENARERQDKEYRRKYFGNYSERSPESIGREQIAERTDKIIPGARDIEEHRDIQALPSEQPRKHKQHSERYWPSFD